jgi:Predicted acetyltransferase
MYKEKIKQLLRDSYPKDCTKIAPFALWKMDAIIDGGEAYYLSEYDCCYVIYNNHLLFYSSPDDMCHIPISELNKLDAISLPDHLFNQMKDELHGFNVDFGWLLTYDFNYIPPLIPDNRYSAVDFDFTNEGDYQCAANIIGSSWISAEQVRRMTEFTAFDPSLWFFVYDNKSDKKIAISISTYSPEVRETLLDWIFVLPDYQGKGAGRFLINETIARCKEKSDLICVGGTVEFYRRCGFVDNTLWVWATKPDYDFICEAIQP